jgi:hypothetical protein
VARRSLGGVEAVRDGLNAKNSQGPETAIWLGVAVDALRARPDQMGSFVMRTRSKSKREHAGIEKGEQVFLGHALASWHDTRLGAIDGDRAHSDLLGFFAEVWHGKCLRAPGTPAAVRRVA